MASDWSRLVAACLLPCCTGGPRQVLEDRGPKLAYDVVGTGASIFAWLAGGAEIAYVSNTPELIAVRVADGARRQLDAARPYFAANLARSQDAAALYFIAEDLSGPVSSFTVREALAHQTLPVGEVRGVDPAVSADGRRVLYWTASGVPSVADASGAILSASGCSPLYPVLPVFSPSADQLLCGGEPPVLFNLADGSTQEVPDGSPGLWRAVRWRDGELQVVALAAEQLHERVYLLDLVRGGQHSLYDTQEGLLDFAHAAISADGRQVAFWETECLHAQSFLSCEPGQTEARLKVVETASGQTRTVATGAGDPGQIAFADDGVRIAYVFGSGLHLRALP